jgi:hypothetical protein
MDGNMRNSLTPAQAHQMAMARQSILVQAQQAQQHELMQRVSLLCLNVVFNQLDDGCVLFLNYFHFKSNLYCSHQIVLILILLATCSGTGSAATKYVSTANVSTATATNGGRSCSS